MSVLILILACVVMLSLLGAFVSIALIFRAANRWVWGWYK